MAHRRVNIHRLHRIATGKMDAIEILGQFEEILVVLMGAGAATGVQVGTVRRARHIAEQDIVATNGKSPIQIARCQREDGGNQRQLFHHHIAVEPHIFTGNRRTVAFEDLNRFGVQHFDADFLKHPHGGVVNFRHTLLVDRFGGAVVDDGELPIHLTNGGATASGIAFPAPAARSSSATSHVVVLPISSSCAPKQITAHGGVSGRNAASNMSQTTV